MDEGKETKLVLAKFSESNVSRELRRQGVERAGQAVTTALMLAGILTTITRHVRLTGGKWMGRHASYYGADGHFVKQEKAVELLETAREEAGGNLKSLKTLLKRQETMEKAFKHQKEELKEELSKYDLWAAEITSQLVSQAEDVLDAAIRVTQEAEARLKKTQNDYPLEAEFTI